MSQESYNCFNCEYSKICDETINFDCPYDDEEDCWYEGDED